jgi:pimeloyl-ACP methyl ester carboxylesterase
VPAEVITLPDGRALEIEVSGPPDGLPFVFHHGTPGCSHQRASTRAELASRGLRYVTYSRAGARRSTRNPGRSVADVAGDIAAVLDHLGAERCLTGGASGGGPHALATGALLPERVVGVLSICGVRPYDGGDGFLDGAGQDNHDGFALALQGEDALRPYLMAHREALLEADAEGFIARLDSLLPDVDRAVLTGELGTDMLAGFQGGVEVVDGWLDDDLAFTKPWGFDLAALTVPTFVWQGTADLMVPFHHGQYLAERIPGAVVHLEEGEGHLSLAVAAFGAMLDEALASV